MTTLPRLDRNKQASHIQQNMCCVHSTNQLLRISTIVVCLNLQLTNPLPPCLPHPHSATTQSANSLLWHLTSSQSVIIDSKKDRTLRTNDYVVVVVDDKWWCPRTAAVEFSCRSMGEATRGQTCRTVLLSSPNTPPFLPSCPRACA